MSWRVSPAVTADAHWIAPRMSAADAAEVWAAGRLTPLAALTRSMEMSLEARTWHVDGEPACMFGFAVPSLLGGWANPWLLSTPEVRRYRYVFLRNYRAELDRILTQFPVLVTMVDARHTVCLRWLKWTGFEISEAEPYGVEGEPFHRVALARA